MKSRLPMKGIIFDCDGVLINSRKSNIDYYNLLRKELGLPPMCPEDEEFTHMSSGEQALQRIAPVSLQPLLRDAIKRIDYVKEVLPLLKPEEFLQESLEHLSKKSIRLGICTNRDASMGLLLEQFGMTHFFSPVVTAGMFLPKPAPDGLLFLLKDWNVQADEVVFVGDSEADMKAAAGANVPFWAFNNPSLTALRHVTSFSELLVD